MIAFDTEPSRYRHWRLGFDGRVATLALAVDEAGGLGPSYRLKLNSYDLSVDIELADALNRIRFEHPEVGAVVVTSDRDRVFSAGANIYMLARASHADKVNFCKFTNETRNGIEDSSRHSGVKFVAAVNGACAGGGYELALACDEIVMVDDRSTTVSLPEVPSLGVLPGTGGLTRLVDKRKVRRDLADVFCTTAEGVRAPRAKEWGLVDHVAPPARFYDFVAERVAALAATSDRPVDATGVVLPPLTREIDARGYHYEWVDVACDREKRVATLAVRGPHESVADANRIIELGARWWPFAMARELDDALLMLRANETLIGTLVLKTAGEVDAVVAADMLMAREQQHWFVRETIGLLRRTLQRLDLSSKSLFAVIDEGSCFAGSLFELALAADRSYMLDDGPKIALSPLNFGGLEMVNGSTRLAVRFGGDPFPAGASPEGALDAAAALARGLVTSAPDRLDWDDEIRLAIEERAGLSPDALTALEANLRFAGQETVASKIFARLSAWQNWIFSRPNATGEMGALKSYGSGRKPAFDWERV